LAGIQRAAADGRLPPSKELAASAEILRRSAPI